VGGYGIDRRTKQYGKVINQKRITKEEDKKEKRIVRGRNEGILRLYQWRSIGRR